MGFSSVIPPAIKLLSFKNRLISHDIKSHEAAEYTREELNPDVWGRLKAEALAKLTAKKEVTEDGMFKCNRCKVNKKIRILNLIKQQKFFVKNCIQSRNDA